MKSIEQIRRENVAAEVKRLGGQAKFAEAIGGKNKNQVYQWLTDNPKQIRNISRTTARRIEPLIGRDAGWLDIDHGRAALDLRSSGPELVAVRSKNHVKALRFAVQSLFSVLHDKMPALAEDVAQDIVETAGTEFAGAGFLNTLVGYLRGDDGMLEEEDLDPQRIPVSQASKRAAAGAKKT